MDDTQMMESPVDLFKLLTVYIDEEKMAATVKIIEICPVKVTIFDILEFLKKFDVTHGLQSPQLKKLTTALRTKTGEEFLVARGIKPEQGKEGASELFFRTSINTGKVEHDRINFKERDVVNSVNKGDTIAKIIKEVYGKSGVRIDGLPEPAQFIPFMKTYIAGMNVEMIDEGAELIYKATESGHARLLFNSLQVIPDFHVLSAVDYQTGNIDFFGNIFIHGDVCRGFSVKAGGDIVIIGNIESGAVVKALGDVTVNGNIQCGKSDGVVEAGKSLFAIRILNSLVKAGKEILIKKEVVDCEIRCDGVLCAKGVRIIGCNIEAVGGILCGDIGVEEEKSSVNKIDIGSTFDTIKALEKLDKELERIKIEQTLLMKDNSKKVGKGMLDEKFDNLSIDEQDRIKRLGLTHGNYAKKLMEQQKFVEEQRTILLPFVKSNPAPKIAIQGTVYPECVIRVQKGRINILDTAIKGSSLPEPVPFERTP